MAVQEVNACKEQLHHPVMEGMLLRKISSVPNNVPDLCESETMEIINDVLVNKKKRALPGRVSEGMESLQGGLKAMDNALALADPAELHDIFLAHISCIKDVISHSCLSIW